MAPGIQRPRLHDWVSGAATVAAIGAPVMLIAGRPWLAGLCAAAAFAGALAARRSSRRHPAPMPYAMRWVLYLPRWPLSPTRLAAILQPRSGERVLELGPGVGIYSLPIAASLAPGGTLETLDIQPEMLASLVRRAADAGVTNIGAAEGDAQRLPHADGSFDAAYLVGVLGEIPDPSAALRELRRVLKPGGRLVVGEVLGLDPDAVRLATLRTLAHEARDSRSSAVLGPRFGYFARFAVARR